MGELRAVTDTHSGRRYAFKGPKPDAPAAVRARFREEALVWIALGHHENVVEALWLIEEDPGPFLVLEYVEGRNLADVLAERPPALPRALDLALQCAAGLHYAHTKPVQGGVGVVHRDLKPANLLVRDDFVLKIGDFGLARVFRSAAADAGGTPAYMAPEQLTGEEADGRADIYAFGLVLYEMLAGGHPLRADSLNDQVERTLHDVPPPLDDVPPALSALVARCIAKDPADRPRDAAEALGHLAAVARGVEPPGSWHVDPAGIALPAEAAGLVASEPVLRPRRPRAGEPCVVEVDVYGDVGRGPVEIAWTVPEVAGLEWLTPGRERRLRLDAGGSVRVRLIQSLLALREGAFPVPASELRARGPDGERTARVPPFDAEIAFAFHLPLRGRDEEMGRLEKALDATARGGGATALLLFGGIGAGKTRLLREVAVGAAERGARVVYSRARESGLRPMRVLHDLAREIFASLPERSYTSAVNALLGHDPVAAAYFQAVLAGGTPPETPSERPWFSLLEAVARGGPLVVLLDDLHLAHENAARIVLALAARAHRERWPLLLVGTAGAPEQAATAPLRLEELERGRVLWGRRGVEIERIELGPLDRSAIDALVEDAFEGHGFREEAPWFLETIAHTTAGNPFHVAEILRALRSEGLVGKRDGEWRLKDGLRPAALRQRLPGALAAAVRRRLALASEGARRVLELAALLGDEFDASVLRAAHGDPARVDAALAELEDREVLAPVRRQERYRFWSAVAVPVLRGELERDPARRAGLHRAVAEGLLRVYQGEQRVRRALNIARHLRAAGLPARSLPFTLLGCRRLVSMHLVERARRLLANAEPFLDLPGVEERHRAAFDYLYGLVCESTGSREEARASLARYVERGLSVEPGSRPRAYLRLGRLHQGEGEYEEAGRCYEEARRLFEEIGDRRRLAFVYLALAALFRDRAEVVPAQQHLERARALARETLNEGAAVQALILEGELALVLEQYVPARRAFSEARDRAAALGDRRREADALERLGQVAIATGYLRDARGWIEEAIHLLARMGDRPRLARAFLHLGDLRRAAGDVSPALRFFRRALRIYDELGLRDGAAAARHRIGLAHGAAGRPAEAVRELARAAEEFAQLDRPERRAVLRDLAGALADAGGGDRPARIALARADRGEPPGPGRRAHRVASRVIRVRLALARDGLRRARALARAAVRQAARAGGHRTRAAAQLAVARTALHAGDLPAARGAATTAQVFARAEHDAEGAAAAERILRDVALRARTVAGP